MDTVERFKGVCRRTFTSGHCTVGEEEDRESWNNQVTDFMRSKIMEEFMVEDRHLWPLGMDRGFLAVYNRS